MQREMESESAFVPESCQASHVSCLCVLEVESSRSPEACVVESVTDCVSEWWIRRNGVRTFLGVSRVDESGVAGWRIIEIGRSKSLGHGPRIRDERRGEGAEDVVQVDAEIGTGSGVGESACSAKVD